MLSFLTLELHPAHMWLPRWPQVNSELNSTDMNGKGSWVIKLSGISSVWILSVHNAILKRLQSCCSVFSERNESFVRIQKDKRIPNLCTSKVQSSKVWGKILDSLSQSHSWSSSSCLLLGILALLHTCLFCLELKWAQVQSLQTNKFPAFQGKRLSSPQL